MSFVCEDVVDQVGKCDFARAYCDLEGLNYLDYHYCAFHGLSWLSFIVWTLWLVMLFLSLAVTADRYFCPSLEALAESLHLPDDVSGVTLLALGNGAPDIFSVFVGLTAAEDDDLALTGLLGGGVFVCALVFGSITVLHKQTLRVQASLFVRDASTYLVTVLFLLYVCINGTVELWHTVLLIVLYIAYVLLVVFRERLLAAMARYPKVADYMAPTPYIGQVGKGRTDDERQPLLDEPPLELRNGVQNVDICEARHGLDDSMYGDGASAGSAGDDDDDEPSNPVWRAMLRVGKVLGYPLEFLRWCTIPPFEEDDYQRWRVVVAPVAMPLFVWYSIMGSATLDTYSWSAGLPVPVFLIAGGAVLSGVAYFVAPAEISHGSRFANILLPTAFMSSLLWHWALAKEMVSVLQTFGILLNLSTGVLGITVLAWANSASDYIANVKLAGAHPGMAVAASFAEPLLNLALGMSASLLIRTIEEGGAFELGISNKVFIALAAQIASLLISLVVVSMNHWKVPRPLGYFLIAYYCAFTLFSVLDEVLDISG